MEGSWGGVEDIRYHDPMPDRKSDYGLDPPLAQAPPTATSLAIHASVDPAMPIKRMPYELGRLAPAAEADILPAAITHAAMKRIDGSK